MPPFSLSLTRNRHLQFHLQQGNKHQQLNLQENLFTYQHTYTYKHSLVKYANTHIYINLHAQKYTITQLNTH